MTDQLKKRHPAAAALLSFVVMGLGQLYNGRTQRAVVFFVLEILGLVASVNISMVLIPSIGVSFLVLWVSIFIGLRIVAVVDAFIAARRIGEVELQSFNRWYVYVPILLVPFAASYFIEIPVASYSIASRSTQPALLPGDYVFVDKTSYRDHAPERGDIAVFQLSRDTTIHYIKRIVGMPGDRIQMLEGVLHINGMPVQLVRTDDFVTEGYAGNRLNIAQYIETLPNGVSYRVLDEKTHSSLDNTAEYIVPEGHYFTLGDNRDNSSDSRSSVGFVPAGNFVGRAEVIYFSQDVSAKWWQVWSWPQTIRSDRIGDGIE